MLFSSIYTFHFSNPARRSHASFGFAFASHIGFLAKGNTRGWRNSGFSFLHRAAQVTVHSLGGGLDALSFRGPSLSSIFSVDLGVVFTLTQLGEAMKRWIGTADGSQW